jgi:hypothetical protein
MKHNVGTLDRIARLVAAALLLVGALLAPLTLAVRIGALAAPAVYMLGTALAGTCLGYRLMGKSTCPATMSFRG